MVPRTDDQIMARASFWSCVLQMLTIVLERSQLIAIVSTGDGEDRQGYASVLIRRGAETVPEGIALWMRNPFLKRWRRIAKKRIECIEGSTLLEPRPELATPERLVGDYAFLQRVTGNPSQPLHGIERKNIVAHRRVHAAKRRRDGHDADEAWRELFRRGPLREAHIRLFSHSHLAIAVPLARQPLHHVVTILGFMCTGSKDSL